MDPPANFVVDSSRFAVGAIPPERSLAFIDLASSDGAGNGFVPPSYPVIGIGPRDHPLAAALDAVVEPPIGIERLVAQVGATPLAAAAAVRLLRMLPDMAIEPGLVAESATYAMLQGSDEHKRWLGLQRAPGARPTPPGMVRLDRDDGRMRITLDRAVAGNAIDRAMRDALYEAFAVGSLDDAISEVELRANGRVFSLGADLVEFGTTADPATAHAIRARTLPAVQAARCAHKLVAHIDGACIGAGLELAAFAHRITASRRAWFHLPELAMGVIPGAGGCVSLTRRIGRQRTALMILSGQRLGARQALDWGLIDALVDQPA